MNILKNKKLIILFGGIILLLIIVFLLIMNNRKPKEVGILSGEPTPEFLSEERKAYYGLAPETKAQVFYDDEGYEVYKIIRSEDDIVTEPSF